MLNNSQDSEFLKDALVLTVHKSFWASKECEVFPNRVYTKIFFGYSQNLFNSFFLMLKAVLKFFILRPKLIFVGSAVRIVPWLAYLKRKGLLGKTKLIVTDYPNDQNAQFFDRIILFSQDFLNQRAPGVREKYIFFSLPADGKFDINTSPSKEKYIFSGGGENRDFKSLVDAVKGLDIDLKIVTFSPEKLGPVGTLPSNCEVFWTMPIPKFLELMAGSLFVVVPLIDANYPHGQTTLVQALSLGKAVIVTKNVGIHEYVTDGKEGILVEPGDVAGYKLAISKLMHDPNLRQSFERAAKVKAAELSYSTFAKKLVELCKEVLDSSH